MHEPTSGGRARGERSEAELTLAWLRGEPTAGRALFERHFETVRRFFRHKVSASALDDLVQQTFLACVEARARFRGESSFRTFLFQIARHQLHAHYRRRRGARVVANEITRVRDLRISPVEQLSRQDDAHVLLQALQGLPVEQQWVLELVFWEDCSAAEVACVLGIAASTVYTRLYRAKTLLQQRMRDADASFDAHAWSRTTDEVSAWMASLPPWNAPADSRSSPRAGK